MFWRRADRRRVKGLFLAGTLLVAGASSAAAQAVEPDVMPLKVATAVDADSASITLFWPHPSRRGDPGKAVVQPIGVSSAVVGQEIRLGFDRPVGDTRLDRLPQRLAGWVDNVQYGYDSVLVVMSEGVEGVVDATASGVVVHLARKPKPRPAAAELVEEKAERQRLDYLDTVVMMQQGRVKPARARLNELIHRDPRDVQSVQLLATAEERLGRWREALALTQQALRLTPHEPELIRAKRQLLREHADFARLDVDLFAVRNGDTQRAARLTGRSDAGARGSFEYSLERRTIDADQVNGRDGVSRAFQGVRHFGRLSYTKDWPDAESTRVSLFAAHDVAGAGVQHEWRDGDRTLRFGGHWREPTTSTLESIVHAGWRHRVFAEWEEKLAPRWQLTAGGGWNLYGLGTDSAMARTATANGSLFYTLRQGDPTVTIGYLFDAEYVADNAVVADVFGNPVHPLSLATREVHSGQVGFDRQLTDYLRATLVAGYAWDRRTHGAPYGSLSLVYEPQVDLEMGLRASRARSTARGTADQVDQVGGYLLWRY